MLTLRKQSLLDTKKLAHHLAGFLAIGDLLLLYGDLGSGKTTFTRELVQALGADKNIIVNSPTFTILQQYSGHGLPFPIYHFDAYRLENIGAADQGFEDYIASDGLTLIEWPQFMADILPNEYLKIEFAYDKDARDIMISASGEHYRKLLEKL
ncbi:tRNA (adenosine(37)-N6)-threonylcarbamoyltransferase complex ATPase subunit type 1 TsaE [Oenococcus sp. UCMA 16435]|nr:tRNA (adenosine(37)-N6)-threonylcarbamoyltransferase complex ATPase subunit type 1 TsaE [Oenococcus sp. UCMA 16435]MDI4583757.1 tRNA (adenosine(37)-N6)-threonylcarbamoyltransferase complex ATPase subunit type 1 TsaE [Oenococcus sp. UCMA 14587]